MRRNPNTPPIIHQPSTAETMEYVITIASCAVLIAVLGWMSLA